MKKKLNNKGFSLGELIVVVAILGLLVGTVAISAMSAVTSSQKKVDAVSIKSFEIVLCNALQNTATHKDAQSIIDNTTDNKIVFVCTVKDNVLVLDYCYITDKTYGPTNNASTNSSGQALTKLTNDVIAYVNSHIDPVELKSQFYKKQIYEITITLSDIDFLPHSSVTMKESK